MRGHGDIRAVGGRGSEAAGGGSGGRIALYTTTANEYRGAFTVSSFKQNIILRVHIVYMYMYNGTCF